MKSNYEKSCQILNIIIENENDISSSMLNKQYRKMSLLHHPDKNSDNTSEKFHEISNAYEFLGKYLGYTDDDDYSDLQEYDEETDTSNWIKNKIISYFKTVGIEKKIYLYKTLYKYKDKLGISDSLFKILSYILSLNEQ